MARTETNKEAQVTGAFVLLLSCHFAAPDFVHFGEPGCLPYKTDTRRGGLGYGWDSGN